ncbi:hypothetical protein GIB67_002694, partial [Kingdonia uniflora]
FDKEVNEQVDEENQTQDGRAKKDTFNTKNYTSRCIGVGLNKMFVALPEEEKGVLRITCFAPLMFIDPITTMSMLVVEIFDRHLGDMKFQFGGTIIQMKPIHVYLILGLRVSLIANEFLFVDPEHLKNFRMRRYSSIKFVKNYTIISPPEQREKRWGERNYIEALAISAAAAIEPPAVSTPAVGTPAIGSSSSATEIGTVVVRVYSQLEEHGKMLLNLDYHEDGKRKKAEPRTWQRDLQQKNQKIEEKKKDKEERHKKTNTNKKNKKEEEADVPLKKKAEGTKIEDLTDEQLDHVPLIQLKTLIPKIPNGLANRAPRKRRAEFLELENIQSTAENLLQQVAPGEGLEVVKDLMVDDDVEVGREVNLEVISSEYGGDLLEWKKGEKIGEEKAEDDKDMHAYPILQMGDLKQETVVVYYDGKKDIVEEANETMVTKTDIVFFDQEKVVGKAYQASADQTTIVSIDEQTMEVTKIEDEASQLVLMESEVDATLKKRHTLTDEDINERVFKMACQMNQLHIHLDELLPGVLFQSFI